MSTTKNTLNRRKQKTDKVITKDTVLYTLVIHLQECIISKIKANFKLHPENPLSWKKKSIRDVRATLTKRNQENQLRTPEEDLWINFPRNFRFYSPLIAMISEASKNSSGVLVQILCDWLSPERTDNNPFSFPTFVSKISNDLSPRQTDLLALIIALVVGDLLSYHFSRESLDSMDSIPSHTYLRIVVLALNYFKPMPPMYLEPSLWKRMVKIISNQWAIVFSRISPYLISSVDGSALLKQYISIDSQAEDLNPILFGMRYLTLSVHSQHHVTQSDSMLSDIFKQIISKDKSQTLKMSCTQILESAISSVNLKNCPSILRQIAEFLSHTKTLIKTARSEESENTVTKLRATLIAHGPESSFLSKVETFWNKSILKYISSPKKVEACLDSILRILRGQFPYKRAIWQPYQQQSHYEENDDSDSAPCITYLDYHESPFLYAPFCSSDYISKDNEGMDLIHQFVTSLFGAKGKIPKTSNSPVLVELCVQITLQIAAHSIDYAMKELFPIQLSGSLLDNRVALVALQRMVDNNYGFFKNAWCLQAKNIVNSKDSSGNIPSIGSNSNMPPASTLKNQVSDEKRKSALDFFNSAIVKTLKRFSQELETDGVRSDRTILDCYLRDHDCPFKPFEQLSVSKSHQAVILNSNSKNSKTTKPYADGSPEMSHKDIQLKATLNRISKLIGSTPPQRIMAQSKRYDKMDNHVKAVIHHWCQIAGIPTPEFESLRYRLDGVDHQLLNLVDSSERTTITNSTSQSNISSPIQNMVRKTNHMSVMIRPTHRKKTPLNLLLSSLLDSIVILPSRSFFNSLNNDTFIGQLILHSDEEISTVTSHFLQKMIVEKPSLRVFIISGLCQFIKTLPSNHEHSQFFVLQHIRLLLDLWNASWYSINSDKDYQYSTTELTTFLCELEHISLLHLCSSVPEMRVCALNIIEAAYIISVNNLSNVSDVKSSSKVRVASLIDKCQRQILQRARYHYLKDSSQTLTEFNLPHTTPILLTIKDVAASSQQNIWSYVLGEVGKTCVSNEVEPLLCLYHVRKSIVDLLEYEESQSNTPSSPTTPYQSPHMKPVRYRNFQILLYSTCSKDILNPKKGSEEDTTTTTTTEPTEKAYSAEQKKVDKILGSLRKKNHQINYESSSQQLSSGSPTHLDKINISNRIKQLVDNGWRYLQSDSFEIVQTKVFACGLSHWDLSTYIVDSLWKWYEMLTVKLLSKRRLKARTEVAKIYRLISEHELFKTSVNQNTSSSGEHTLIQCYLLFIREIIPVFSSYDRIASFYVADYFIDNVSIIKNLFEALHQPIPWIKTGTLRKALLPKSKISFGDSWDHEVHFPLLKMLIQWAGLKKSNRFKLDRTELAKVQKQSVNANGKRTHDPEILEATLSNLYRMTGHAIQSMALVGPIVSMKDREKLHRSVPKWLLCAENLLNCRILKWVLSSTMNQSFKIFLDHAYPQTLEDESEVLLFINAIYDQFLPNHLSSPANGITQDFAKFITERTISNNYSVSSGISLTESDIHFGNAVNKSAGELLHLILHNMIHPDFSIRTRSFDMIYRIGPVLSPESLDTDSGDTSSTAVFAVRQQLAECENAFNSNVSEVSRKSAQQISGIISEHCAHLSEQFFNASFDRFKQLVRGRDWAIETLHPWAHNISLQPATPSSKNSSYNQQEKFNPKQFLESLFLKVSHPALNSSNSREASAVFELWQHLAHTSTNLKFILEYLVTKCILKSCFDSAKRIILSLYQHHSKGTLQFLVHYLTIEGIVQVLTKISTGGIDPGLDIIEVDKSGSGLGSSGSSGDGRVKSDKEVSLSNSYSDKNDMDIESQRNGSVGTLKSPSSTGKINVKPSAVKRELTTNSNTSIENNSASAKKTREISYQLRAAVASIITDIISQDIVPLLPHIHVIVNYTLLRFDSNEGVYLNKLFFVLLIAVRGLVSQSDGTLKLSSKDNANLDALMALTKEKTLRIRWAVTPPESSSSPDIISSIPNPSSKSVYLESPRHSSLRLSSTTQHDVLKWFVAPMNGDEIVSIMISILKVVQPDCIVKWGAEALTWVMKYKDVSLSTKALEMYCEIKQPFGFDVIKGLVATLHDSLKKLAANFLRSTMAKTTLTNKSNENHVGEKDTQNDRDKAQSDPNSRVLTVRTNSILLTLERLSMYITETTDILLIFWVAVCLLQLSSQSTPELFNATLRLLHRLSSSPVFLKIDPNSDLFLSLLSRARAWDYGGLYHLVCKSLKSCKTEMLGVQLLIQLNQIPFINLVCSPLPTVDRQEADAILLLRVLPWLALSLESPRPNDDSSSSSSSSTSSSSSSKSPSSSSEKKKYSFDLAKELSVSLAPRFQTSSPKLTSLLSDYSKGSFTLGSPAGRVFLKEICESLYPLLFPHKADNVINIMVTMLSESSRKFREKVVDAAYQFASQPQAPVALFRKLLPSLTVDISFLRKDTSYSHFATLLLEFNDPPPSSASGSSSSDSTFLDPFEMLSNPRDVDSVTEAVRVMTFMTKELFSHQRKASALMTQSQHPRTHTSRTLTLTSKAQRRSLPRAVQYSERNDDIGTPTSSDIPQQQQSQRKKKSNKSKTVILGARFKLPTRGKYDSSSNVPSPRHVPDDEDIPEEDEEKIKNAIVYTGRKKSKTMLSPRSNTKRPSTSSAFSNDRDDGSSESDDPKISSDKLRDKGISPVKIREKEKTKSLPNRAGKRAKVSSSLNPTPELLQKQHRNHHHHQSNSSFQISSKYSSAKSPLEHIKRDGFDDQQQQQQQQQQQLQQQLSERKTTKKYSKNTSENDLSNSSPELKNLSNSTGNGGSGSGRRQRAGSTTSTPSPSEVVTSLKSSKSQMSLNFKPDPPVLSPRSAPSPVPRTKESKRRYKKSTTNDNINITPRPPPRTKYAKRETKSEPNVEMVSTPRTPQDVALDEIFNEIEEHEKKLKEKQQQQDFKVKRVDPSEKESLKELLKNVSSLANLTAKSNSAISSLRNSRKGINSMTNNDDVQNVNYNYNNNSVVDDDNDDDEDPYFGLKNFKRLEDSSEDDNSDETKQKNRNTTITSSNNKNPRYSNDNYDDESSSSEEVSSYVLPDESALEILGKFGLQDDDFEEDGDEEFEYLKNFSLDHDDELLRQNREKNLPSLSKNSASKKRNSRATPIKDVDDYDEEDDEEYDEDDDDEDDENSLGDMINEFKAFDSSSLLNALENLKKKTSSDDSDYSSERSEDIED
eukprot:TRINITY_DN1114_c0_g2_i1.p1 TRINITY_DN1114_c0_g2~~TRINITY_DN1114_c0_g2_i1.p1  ORF type:complete len:3192 (+),score=811.12 TRINITY_DN1114_c0_g2_i1:26-9601(+)